MAIYVVGDLQGCSEEFEALLKKIRFDRKKDRLWLVGDLVNRGPGSLEILRTVMALGDSAITVLGNHDLHLLAVAEGVVEKHRSDTLEEVLHAPDRKELLKWLRHQPLIHVEGGFVLLHAGLFPAWTIAQAQKLAHEVEKELRSKHHVDFFRHMYGNKPSRWDEGLTGYDRLRAITNAFTRMRICTEDGEMEFRFKGELQDIPEGYLPWYEVPGRKSSDKTLIFGHWSALGLLNTPGAIALDTGCLWGGPLTAMRLEDRKIFQVPCARADVVKDW